MIFRVFVSVCLCVCVCACVRSWLYACVARMHMYTSVHAVHAYIRACTCVCGYVWARMLLSICLCVSTCVSTYGGVRACMIFLCACVCMLFFICTPSSIEHPVVGCKARLWVAKLESGLDIIASSHLYILASDRPTIHPSACSSVCLSACLSVCPSAGL